MMYTLTPSRTLRQLYLSGITCLDICQRKASIWGTKAWEGVKNWRGFAKACIMVRESRLEKVI